jgi:hypothetical protein
MVTSTIGSFSRRIAVSKLIRHGRFSGVPKIFLKAKSLIGRIPSGIAVGGSRDTSRGWRVYFSFSRQAEIQTTDIF